MGFPRYSIDAKRTTAAALLAMSLFEAFVTLNTETEPPLDEQVRMKGEKIRSGLRRN